MKRVDNYREGEYSFELWEMKKANLFCIYVRKNGNLIPEQQMSSRVFDTEGNVTRMYTESEMRRFMVEKIEKLTGVDAMKVDESDFDKLVADIEGQYALAI